MHVYIENSLIHCTLIHWLIDWLVSWLIDWIDRLTDWLDRLIEWWIGLDRIGSDRIGLDWIGLDWFIHWSIDRPMMRSPHSSRSLDPKIWRFKWAPRPVEAACKLVQVEGEMPNIDYSMGKGKSSRNGSFSITTLHYQRVYTLHDILFSCRHQQPRIGHGKLWKQRWDESHRVLRKSNNKKLGCSASSWIWNGLNSNVPRDFSCKHSKKNI